MRDDVKNLLEMIGQPELRYREFDTDSKREESGYWPLFEALAMHPVLARRDWQRGTRTTAATTAPAADTRRDLGTEAAPETLFSRFGTPSAVEAAAAPTPAEGGDIRSLLRRLSDQMK